MTFRPEEVLFSPTTACNLNCLHCGVPRSKTILPGRYARRFLRECAGIGVERVGFTGGEPFLAPGFMLAIVRDAVREGMLFGRIMTNAVWWRSVRQLRKTLSSLRDAGYDGSICVSVDALHAQEMDKVARFIKCADEIWARPDMVSIACVSGFRDRESAGMIRSLARLVGGKSAKSPAGTPYIKSQRLFIKITDIGLSPTGKASGIKEPWDGKWFKDDMCSGPGNAFLVMPDGSVKPCCGYASDNEGLTIGNIRRDSARDIMNRFRRNRFALTVFGSGLGAIRKRLERLGVRFPGRTSSHCFFCEYLLNEIPKGALERCLDA